MYNKLAAKVNNINTSAFVLKTKYNTDKPEFKKKNPDTSGLVKKQTKLTEIKDKIPDISSLATKTALTTVENKIPNINNLVEKTDCDTKTTEIKKKLTNRNHDKYITTPEFNTLAARLTQDQHKQIQRQKQILIMGYHVLIVKLQQIKQTLPTSNENELKKLKAFDLSYFRRKSH